MESVVIITVYLKNIDYTVSMEFTIILIFYNIIMLH